LDRLLEFAPGISRVSGRDGVLNHSASGPDPPYRQGQITGLLDLASSRCTPEGRKTLRTGAGFECFKAAPQPRKHGSLRHQLGDSHDMGRRRAAAEGTDVLIYVCEKPRVKRPAARQPVVSSRHATACLPLMELFGRRQLGDISCSRSGSEQRLDLYTGMGER
jgi:hypothetical protein